MLWSLISSGVVVVLLMVGHTTLGLGSIYGSGVGAGTRDGFFAPFVNPNHGGIFCAAMLPIALSRVVDGRPRCKACESYDVGTVLLPYATKLLIQELEAMPPLELAPELPSHLRESIVVFCF